MATFNSSEPDSAVQISSNGAEQTHIYQGDANTLSPMENNHNVIKNNENNTKADLMTMSTPPHLLSAALENPEDGQPLLPKRYYNHRNSSALQKEREERVRKIREAQEEERNKKIEELKTHAAQQQKFREIQEVERRKRFEEQRARDHDKFIQVEERRRAIESAERERRGALLKKNQEREGKIFAKKKALNNQTYFAFGSCTPRMGYSISGSGGRSDSGTDVCRSTSSSNMANMSQSMYSTSSSSRHHDREHQVNHQRRSSEREMNGGTGAKRAISVHALDQSAEIDAEGDNTYHHANSNPGSASAHRRRTDLMPTITFSTASPAGCAAGGPGGGTGNGYSRSSTPGNRMLRSPGKAVSMSRLDTLSKPRNLRLQIHQTSVLHANSASANQTSTPKNTRQGSNKTNSPQSTDSQKSNKNWSKSMTHLGPKKLSPMQATIHTKSKGRSPSAMSTDRGTDTPSGSQNVKLRPGTASHRRPRPISIATTGVLSTSMYEKRSSSSNANTPTQSHHITATGFDKSSKHPDMKSKRPVTKSASADHKDVEEFARPTKTPSRKTPAQVKAESAARKAKANTKSPTPPLKKQHSRDSMEKNSSNSSKESSVEKQQENNVTPEEEKLETEVVKTSVEPSNEETTGNTEVPTETHPVREATPDIIRKSPVKEVKEIAIENIEDQTPKKNMISSEATEQEQAKMRIAEKRREMKEKKEKEAELERQKQAELERIEAERLAKEEEEERLAMEEAERLGAEARRAEEERLQKAIEEAQKREEQEKRKREDEENKRKEAEKKAQEEAEKHQAELDEKLKRDEDERLARKKRLDEIMARTRGAKSTNSTPKKEAAPATPEPSNEASSEESSTIAANNTVTDKDIKVAVSENTEENIENNCSSNGEHSSLEDPTGDPTKPDLLGDISTSTKAGQQNLPETETSDEEAQIDNEHESLEKGIVDMNISEQAKEEEQIMNAKNQEASLLDLDSVNSSVNLFKQAPLLLETASDAQQPEFDQILDLTTTSNNSNSTTMNQEDSNSNGDGNGDSEQAPPPMATPLIAFEDSINASPKQEVPTADLLS